MNIQLIYSIGQGASLEANGYPASQGTLCLFGT